MNESTAVTTLQTFRHALYGCFERRADALMDLTDALLTAGPVLSPAHLRLEAVYRRSWGSLCAALTEGRVNDTALRALLGQYPLADGQLIYAVDCTVWARCEATTSPERGYYHHSSRHTGGVPVVAGWSYQWISQLSVRRDRWTAPLDVQRVPCTTDVNTAATQIKAARQWCGAALCLRCRLRSGAVGARPGRCPRGHPGPPAQGSLLLCRPRPRDGGPDGAPAAARAHV